MRILEVGCGIALASLVLNQRHANITATDYHPGPRYFSARKCEPESGGCDPFVRTGWDDEASGVGLFRS